MRSTKTVSLVFAFVLTACGGGDPGSGGGTGGNVEQCGPSNCSGCCANGVCQTGSTAAACGKTGAACSVCGNNQICKTSQTCGVDPSSHWRVQPVSATISSSNNGSSWDPDSSPPDAYVDTWCPPSATWSPGETPEASDTYSPSWTSGGCVATAAALLAEPWYFQVFDSDLTTDDTITAQDSYQLTEADFVRGYVTFNPVQGLQSMTVQLQPQ